MNKLSLPLHIIVGLLVTMVLSCSGPVVPATPDAEALQRWESDDSPGLVKRFGKGTVYDMAVSPDGTTIAVTGLISLSTYDFDSMKLNWTSTLVPADPPITTGRGQVAWSPDGGQIATLSEVGITIWDARTGEQRQIFKGNKYLSIDLVTWTQTNIPAVLQAQSGNIILSELRTGRELFSLATDYGSAALDLAQHENILVVANMNGNISSWDTNTTDRKYPAFKICDDYCVYDARVSADGSLLAIVSPAEHDMISVRDLQTGQEIFSHEASGNYAIKDIEWAPDNGYLADAFDNGTIGIWNIATGERLQLLNAAKVIKLAWSPDGSALVSLGQFGSLIVWDVQSGKRLRSLQENTSWVLDVAWSPDGGKFVSGYEDGEVMVREAATNKVLLTLHEPSGWVNNVAWSPTGDRIAYTAGNTLRICKARNGKQQQAWSVESLTLFELEWSPDGSTLASMDYEGKVDFWDPETGERLRSLPAIRFSEAMTWSPDGNLVATSYPLVDREGEQVTLWDPKTGDAVLTKPGIHGLAWSPLEDIAVSVSDNGTDYAGDDRTLVLWDPKTGNELRRFEIGMLLSNLTWSPDGKFLIVDAVQDLDRALLILDAETGRELQRLRGHYDAVTQIVWSPRGDLIASSSWDGTVILWGSENR